MFLTGFLSGSLAVLLIYQVQPELDVQVGVETKAGVCLGVGVVCGLVTMLVSTVGLLLCGLQLGGLLSLAALLVVGHFHSLAPAWVPLSATAAASVVAAALTLRWQKLFTVVYTCVVGAVAVALCVGHLTGTFTLTEQVLVTFHRGSTAPLCWFHWAVAGIVPMLSLSGVLVQWNVTARGASHTAGMLRLHAHARVHVIHTFTHPVTRLVRQLLRTNRGSTLRGGDLHLTAAPAGPRPSNATLETCWRRSVLHFLCPLSVTHSFNRSVGARSSSGNRMTSHDVMCSSSSSRL